MPGSTFHRVGTAETVWMPNAKVGCLSKGYDRLDTARVRVQTRTDHLGLNLVKISHLDSRLL